MPIGTEVGLSPGHILLHGNPAHPSPPPKKKKGTVPNFLAHVYCYKTGGWVKMPLRMEVGLDPGHIVFDGAQLPLQKRRTAPPGTPIFGP